MAEPVGGPDAEPGDAVAAALTVVGGTLLTMAPGSGPLAPGWMTVGSDGRILAVGAGDPPPGGHGRVLDVSGCLVAPGFVSAHSHLFTSGSRGLGMDQSLYGWIDAMTRYTRAADPDDMYWLTLHGALDFLSNGITTAYDFAANRMTFHARADGSGSYDGGLRPVEVVHNQLVAKVDAGIRFVHSFMLDEAWTKGPEAAVAQGEQMLEFAAGYRHAPGYLGCAISGGVQWGLGPELAEAEATLMERHGLVNQPHFLESPFDVAGQQERFDWYRRAGALGPALVFGHFIHTTPAMVAEAAAAGCAMVWQPTSNGRLGSGVADIPAYRAAGMRIGMGLDDQACTDVADPWQNMRFGLYLLRAMSRDPGVLGVYDVLWLHTMGSAEALGLQDHIGSLEAGKWADFVVVDPRRPDTGPVWDPYGTYVLASSLRNLKQVYVGGKLVSEAGVAVGVDAGRVSKEVHTRLAAIGAQVAGS